MTEVVGDTVALLASFEKTWLERADAHVQSSPEAHLGEMLRVALKDQVLRPVDGKVSDGHHTFDELYEHRMALTALAFMAMAEHSCCFESPWKSRLHHDGEVPFGGGWFIVGITFTGVGQISYHYPIEHWDLFRVRELERAQAFDGHSSADVVERIRKVVHG